MALCNSTTCLGLGPEWTHCCSKAQEQVEDPSISSERQVEDPPTSSEPSERFVQFVGDDELSELSKGYTPKNTEANTKWALTNFHAWMQARNKRFPGDPVPSLLLSTSDPATLNAWLCRFVVETRNHKGKAYSPSTIYQLLTALLRHMRTTNAGCPNFLDKKNTHFRPLHGTLDSHFRSLHEQGIGRQLKHSEVISKDEENRLWTSGVLGISTPTSLFNAVFFYNGKNFCLRGGEEHRQLHISQIKRFTDPDHYIYYEYCSKNRAGTFQQKHVDPKIVPIYCTCTVNSTERCHVHLLDLYLQKLPKGAIEADVFYMRPLNAVPKDTSRPWFTNCPVGRNTLAAVVKKMCKEVGIEGKKTNHSLRATGATELFQAKVPERLIQQRTGHRSVEALRVYERTTAGQHENISAILSSSSSIQYSASSVSHTPATTGEINFKDLTNCTINILQQPKNK